MTEEQQEQTKLELAAKQLVEVVGKHVGNMLNDIQIVIYGDTQKKRDQIYKTLKGYGYQWKEGDWELTTPDWINELVADSWIQHEITRD